MAKNFKRKSERKLVVMRASVTAAKGHPTVDCLIRDASACGCRIISDHLSKLPDDVVVHPEGFEKPMTGRIVWRTGRSAGIEFATPS